ncbi:Regulator of V-ATPase in vacuolar membrane protein 1 [Golovinomyces cichoracearum]|uniref:Regulator of V-ATPase in vacuolar membrane protein 1 n=1 Tax=Golovinomyces cichoracearum TaxID=62708 RepID=A0A420IG06_9PEZI|nr:Regulator of V-ATPase in vacuolar membrane protein 1 [Golovinomyces cichoracearum]
MQVVLPGKPVPVIQAICTALWNERRFIAYISGKALVILTTAYSLLQVIYEESEDQLEAIAFDEESGKIAVCTRCSIRIYKPYGKGEDDLKWSLQDTFSHNDLSSCNGWVKTLSWGSAEELLIGDSYLELFSTIDFPKRIWKQKLANHVRFATFSCDPNFIASVGIYDRFVKIWRRQSSETDDTRFDFSYLSHPGAVTNVCWKKPYHIDQYISNVLYTTCSDQILRIWVASDLHSHSVKHIYLWSQIDLMESIKPRALSNRSKTRFAFIVDGRDFILATEQAIQARDSHDDTEDHALSHLIEVANHNPEICIVLDDLGHMSAWGLENVSNKTIKNPKIFNIAHVDGIFLDLPSLFEVHSSQIRCYNYCDKSSCGLKILIHHFDGKIDVRESDMAILLDPSPRSNRLVSKSILTGHTSSITNISQDISGKAIISQTDCNETILWRNIDLHGVEFLSRQSQIIHSKEINKFCILKEGELIIAISKDEISLWETSGVEGRHLASSAYSLDGRISCFFLIPTSQEEEFAYVTAISSCLIGIVWKINLLSCQTIIEKAGNCPIIEEFFSFNLNTSNDLSDFFSVDTLVLQPTASTSLNNPNMNHIISCSNSGLVQLWSLKLNFKLNRVDLFKTNSINTGIFKPALVVGSFLRKVVIVDSTRSKLTIWNLSENHIEHTEVYDAHDRIQSLNWISTQNYNLILAVQFLFRVDNLAQTSYDYLNKGPSWINLRQLNTQKFTPHPIGDSMWLRNGDYMLGAGNQIFIIKKYTDVVVNTKLLPSKLKQEIFDIVERLNSPLPVYHPQFLIQCILADKIKFVELVIIELHKTLTYYVKGDLIDSNLGTDFAALYSQVTNKSSKREKNNFSLLSDEERSASERVTKVHTSFLTKKLAEVSLPQLSESEQSNLIKVVECVANLEKTRKSIDDNAVKFQFSLLYRKKIEERTDEMLSCWREINWAYHSNSQDILIDLVSSHCHGKLLWKHARESGIFMWMTNRETLLTQFEAVARNEYNKTSLRDPVECSLFYFALRKKSTLQGLWRIATWNREQAATMKLLANNFQEKKWKTAAMKNAYVLLGKHRYEYAAAFFLLADCLSDAINVILTQLKDLQLAITVARVYEDDRSPALMNLLENKVLPLAFREGNRWLASWTFWMLQKKEISCQILASPIDYFCNKPLAPNFQTNSFLVEDSALTGFYSHLREKTIVAQISSEIEWNFVLHYVRLYTRMGCHLLALNLVRNWKFRGPSSINQSNIESQKVNLSNQRNPLVLTDSTSRQPSLALRTIDQQSQRNFQEPESKSIFDSFEF